MRPSILALAVSITLMSTNTPASETRITLYSGDFDAVSQSYPAANMPGLAQVSQTLMRELERGDNAIALDQLPIALDVGSVQLTPASSGLRITSQRYDFSLLGQEQLLQQSLGQRVLVEQAGGTEPRRFTGTLLAAGNGLALLQDDGRVRVLANFDSFELERMPAGLTPRPTLRWNIDSPRRSSEKLQLDYATSGLAWQAEYLIRLDGVGQDGRMMMSGAAQVVNRSGLDFPTTTLTLVAGNPNQVRSTAPRAAMQSAPMAKIMVTGATYESGLQAQDSGEYHAYPLRHAVDLPNGSLQRVSLLDPVQGIPWQRRYEVGEVQAGYRPSRPQIQSFDGEQTLPVAVVLAFANDKAAGLGVPLPAGRVRTFQASDSGDALLGEARLGHTAVGQKVELGLGEAFDLSAKRKPTALQLADDRLSLEETIEITLANAKSQDVTINLREALPRWQDWEITMASHRWERLNAQAIRFDVNVPAGKETTLRYSVRYRWPASVRP